MIATQPTISNLTAAEQSEPFLEKLLQRLASLEKFQRTLRESRSLDDALNHGLSEVTRIVGFSVAGFYIVGADGGFELRSVEPSTSGPHLEQVVAAEIERGTFAWALRQSRPVIERNGTTNNRVLLNAMNAPGRIIGMFVGVIEDEAVRAAEDVLGLLSLLLLGITYTIENYQLVSELRAYNDDLQELVRQRTEEIVKANAEIGKTNSELELEIEERRQSEKELQIANSAAEAAGRAKSEFLAVMSHEIRTPMSGVIGFASLLEETGLNEEQKELVQQIHVSGEQLLSLLNDLLDFSKIEAGGLELEQQSVDVRELAWGLVRFISTRAVGKGVEVSFDVEEDVPAVIIGDPTRLRQIVTNLLGNALKFTEKGEILLTIRRVPSVEGLNEPQLLWAVKDSGIGISNDKIGKLFKPFTQADSSTSRKYGGTGLGLAICLKLCEMMGGRIWVDSELGSGSEFKFTLPLREDHSFGGELRVASPLNGIRVFLITRFSHQKSLMLQQFERWGMKVAGFAEDFGQALKLMDKHLFDVLVVDPRSIGVDTLEVWRSVRTQRARQACLLLVQNRAERERIEELRDTLTSCLLKPCPPAALHAALVRLFMPNPTLGVGEPITAPEPFKSGLSKTKRPLSILLVDDNPMNLTIGSQMLRSIGHGVVSAADGNEAIEALRNQFFEMLIMDLNMPDIDGIQTTRLIRGGAAGSEKSDIFITAWTALATVENHEACIDAGMNEFLTKPLNLAELQRVLQLCIKSLGT